MWREAREDEQRAGNRELGGCDRGSLGGTGIFWGRKETENSAVRFTLCRTVPKQFLVQQCHGEGRGEGEGVTTDWG